MKRTVLKHPSNFHILYLIKVREESYKMIYVCMNDKARINLFAWIYNLNFSPYHIPFNKEGGIYTTEALIISSPTPLLVVRPLKKTLNNNLLAYTMHIFETTFFNFLLKVHICTWFSDLKVLYFSIFFKWNHKMSHVFTYTWRIKVGPVPKTPL